MVGGWRPEIEQGIPPPDVRIDWSFAKGMKKGDSAFVPGANTKTGPGHLHYFAKKMGAKFTCKNVVVAGITGIRVWRIE